MSDGDPHIWRDLVIDGERFALVVQTRHGDAVATTAIHRQRFERRIGGVRLRERKDDAVENLSEVGHLSSTMTDKCLAASIAADGQKTVVVTAPDVDFERTIAILTEHEQEVVRQDPGVIFGPDIGLTEEVQDRLSHQPGLADHVTGLSESNGGVSIEVNGYAAISVVESILAVYSTERLRGLRVSIQGFGAVGMHVARLLSAAGVRVVAISNKRGVLVAADVPSLDVTSLAETATRDGGDEWIRAYSAAGVRKDEEPDVLFATPADIFVPAALTSVLAMPGELAKVRAENKDVRSVEEFYEKTRLQLVAEAANHPLTEAAEAYLERNSVTILPDYIANAGGVIGCWDEWQVRHERSSDRFAPLPNDVAERAKRRIGETIRTNVKQLVESSLPAREAAHEIAEANARRFLGGAMDRA